MGVKISDVGDGFVLVIAFELQPPECNLRNIT